MTDNPNPTPPSRLRGALALLAREDVQQRLPALIETIFSLVTLIIQRVRAARAPPPPPPEPARRRSFPLLTVIGAGLGAWATVKVFQEMQVRQNPHYFEGKVVLITGASRGLGRAYAHGFARRGSHLILAARNEDQLNEVAAECRDLNVQIETLVVPTDVTNHAHLEALVKLAVNQFGYMDILVNNAGIRQGGSLLDLGADAVQKHLEVNLTAPINLTLLVLPILIRRGQGHIVNVVSGAGRHTEPFFIPYGTSKHGLYGFSEGLRRELIGTGVKALTVNPGFTDTDMVTEIGPVYQRIGIPMIPPERVVERTLEAIILGLPEVNIGTVETLGGLTSQVFPGLMDKVWEYLRPDDFEDAAKRQYSE